MIVWVFLQFKDASVVRQEEVGSFLGYNVPLSWLDLYPIPWDQGGSIDINGVAY